MSADAADIVMPSYLGGARAIQSALVDAQLNVDDIDYINAHGTGTLANDSTETRAIHRTQRSIAFQPIPMRRGATS